ncbi:P-loop containing nucleoside triphosphate hydrolase protein [Ramicandelaber brevisporus]|nr:P-loop containing nucleoside triphosphate hydrolase protein [Ramicandelaber brevisporus]
MTDVCKQIRPSNLLEYSSVMQTSSAAIEPFSDIFGLDSAVKDLQILLDMWIRQPDKYTRLGIQCPRGVVIHGPTGTAKSMLATGFAQAASASGCNTVYIDGTMIRSAIVGESEARLADVFARVKESAPCVLLIDHLDMIAPRRGTSTSTENTDDRLVAMMLTEIDGIFTKSKRTLLRRGRLDMDIETSVPNDEQRRAIFQGIAQTMPVVLVAGELDDLVQKTSGMTGADIRGICTEAALHALRTDPDATVITRNNFKL